MTDLQLRTGEVAGRPGGARLTALVAVVVMVVVMVGTVVMLLPAGTPLKQSVQSVAAPYFSQNWRVFAPNILKVNRTVEVRAQWRDERGELVRSGWVSLTEIESARVAGHVVTSRIDKGGWNAWQQYLSRYAALNSTQQTRVRDTFIEHTGQGFQPIDNEALVAELGSGDRDVIRFLRMDYMFMRYATVYATAGFDQDIERVQWRVTRHRPNDFQHRFVDEQQYTDAVTTFGWRQSNVRLTDEVVDEYRGVIERTGSQYLFTQAADDAS